MHDPIWVDGRFIRVKQGCPLCEPGLLHGRNGLMQGFVLRPASRSQPRLDFIDHGRQGQSGITHEANINRIVLVDVLGRDRAVDHELACRDVQAKRSSGQARTDREQQVRSAQPLIHCLRCGPIGRAQRQRVGIGQRTLGLHRRNHRDLGQFCKLPQLFCRPSIQDALASPDHRAFCFQQLIHSVLHITC